MGSKPPFVIIPAHVDAEALYGAAQSLERRLLKNLPKISKALRALPGPTAGYWETWFTAKLPNVLSYLEVYAYIISQALPDRRPADLKLLDYGGGWGLMGLLAKEFGVGWVTYLDINAGTTAAVKAIANAIDLPLQEYICGSEHALYSTQSRFDVVVSSDVLEHVYKTDSVFAAIASVCKPGAIVFHHTGANPKNLHQRVTLSKLHRREEPALMRARADVIAAHGIDSAELAYMTRGLDLKDLEAAIDRFKASGEMPTPEHETNTCDLTGYWLERLMDPERVARDMAAAGFFTQVRQSFWGPGRSGAASKAVKHLLNFLSRLSVWLGLRTTFYYGIRGVRT